MFYKCHLPKATCKIILWVNQFWHMAQVERISWSCVNTNLISKCVIMLKAGLSNGAYEMTPITLDIHPQHTAWRYVCTKVSHLKWRPVNYFRAENPNYEVQQTQVFLWMSNSFNSCGIAPYIHCFGLVKVLFCNWLCGRWIRCLECNDHIKSILHH